MSEISGFAPYANTDYRETLNALKGKHDSNNTVSADAVSAHTGQQDSITIIGNGSAPPTSLLAVRALTTEEIDRLAYANSLNSMQTLAPEAPEETFGHITTKTFASGTSVSIHTEAFGEGEERNLLAPDRKVFATITHADGSTEKQQITQSTVFSEDADGRLVINASFTQKPEADEELARIAQSTGVLFENVELLGTAGDDLIIDMGFGNDFRMSRAEINAGEGNNTILSFGTLDIVMGDGDNTVIGRQSGHTASISGGNGNNSISGGFSKVQLGGGNNTVNGRAHSIQVGDGDNNINSSYTNTVIAGQGNNTLNLGIVTDKVSLGDGNNTLHIDSVPEKAGRLANLFSFSLDVGDGNNQITIDKNSENTRIEAKIGNGNNDISFEHITGFMSSFSVGNGNNTLTATSIKNVGSMKLGDGNNTLNADVMQNIYNMHFGNGNNMVNASEMDSVHNMSFGNGNNTVNTQSMEDIGHMAFGDGDNVVNAERTFNAFGFIFGNGNNVMTAHLVEGNFGARFGGGDNAVDMNRSYSAHVSLNVGNGTNALRIQNNENSSISIYNTGESGAGTLSLDVAGDVHGLNFIYAGDTSVNIDGSVYNGSINTQNGTDSFNISGSLFNSYIDLGTGSNALSVGGGIYNSYAANITNGQTNLLHNSIINGEAHAAESNDATQGTALKKFEVPTIAFRQGMHVSSELQEAFARYSMNFV